MTTSGRSSRDSSTGTRRGKLSPNDRSEDDEWCVYADITERLMLSQPRRCVCLDRLDSGDRKLTLPMRKSLFAHVPPFIVFQNEGSTELPAEITRHLLWWRAKKHAPRIVTSVIRKSGFRTTTCTAANWCGTWCSSLSYPRLVKYTRLFSKVNHVPSSMELGNKKALWISYRRMRRRFGEKRYDYMPLTFVLPEDRCELSKYMRGRRGAGLWITKPPDSCAGRGIKIVSRLHEVANDDRSLVVQRYVSRPGLINGVKFDIRLYVLLTSIDPLRLYVYEEGLVRFATVRYSTDADTLSNRLMHLTNTRVNRTSPRFVPNDDPTRCKGNMWSLNCLWKYLSSVENVDTLEIWMRMKDIAIKTVISVEPILANAWRRTSASTYNFYQLFGLDVLLDRQYRPWLLEVNDFPSMHLDTPLCKIVKGQLAKDYLNLVGFHVPDLLSNEELKILRLMYRERAICYNRQLYLNGLAWEDRKKRCCFLKRRDRKDYLKTILRNLSPNDVRVLIRHEDEISRAGRFEKIFPTRDTYRYLDLFEENRYCNLLLDAWENEHEGDRSIGIERLRKLCDKKYHLS